ncbi:MAG: hypothetical protein RL693_378 [Verrucomicrobiota bacterium]
MRMSTSRIWTCDSFRSRTIQSNKITIRKARRQEIINIPAFLPSLFFKQGGSQSPDAIVLFAAQRLCGPPWLKLLLALALFKLFGFAFDKIDDLFLCAEFRLQCRHVDLLDRFVSLCGHHRGNPGGMANHHPGAF